MILFIQINLNTLHTACFVPSLIEIGNFVLDKMLLMLFHCVAIISPWKIGVTLHLITFDSPSMLCAKIEIGPVFLEIKIFKCCIFTNFAFISSIFFHLNKLKSPAIKDCAKFG